MRIRRVSKWERDFGDMPNADLLRVINGRFDEARATLGVTNDIALAKRLGVAPVVVSNWRNGRRNDALLSVARVLTGLCQPTDEVAA